MTIGWTYPYPIDDNSIGDIYMRNNIKEMRAKVLLDNADSGLPLFALDMQESESEDEQREERENEESLKMKRGNIYKPDGRIRLLKVML